MSETMDWQDIAQVRAVAKRWGLMADQLVRETKSGKYARAYADSKVDTLRLCEKELVDALTELVTVRPGHAMDWQDIATAPKDGAEVLVWDGYNAMVSWFVVLDEGGCGEWSTLALCAEEPTHWQPLPAHPVRPRE